MKNELLREFGQDVPGPKSGKYPIGNRLYHLAIVFAGLGASITGALMIPRIRTGIVTRNPYYLSDFVWGITYVTHGLAGVGLVGLVIAHVLLRDSAGEAVDHQGDDLRLHHAPPVPRASRALALGRGA